MAGSAGSFGMPLDPSVCVDVSNGLAGLPSTAYGTDENTARAYCGSDFVEGQLYQMICLPAPTGGQSCNAFYPPNLVSLLYECGYQSSASFVCDPRVPFSGTDGCIGNECCYVMGGGCPIGRPFLVNEQARTALSMPRSDWSAPQRPDTSGLDAATRRALADVYRKDGLSEHASIAAFARFVLECLSLGAPAELVAEAQAALQDEIAHAQLSFGLASAYAGSAIGPGELDVGGCLPGKLEARDSLQRVIREGCIAETVSAALIQHASEVAEDACVKASLARVAEDERRHAVLAWRFARWLIGRDASLLALAQREFAAAPGHVGFGAVSELPGDAQALRAHGVLPIAERRAVAEQILRQVVEPCALGLAVVGSVSAADSVQPQLA
jgi:hypothetical protein